MQSISEKIKTNKENIAQQQTKNTSQDQDLSSLSQAIDELNKSVKNTYLPLTGGELTGPVSSNAKISSPLFEGELKGTAGKAKSAEISTAENEAKVLVLDPENEADGKIQVASGVSIDPATNTLKAEKIEAGEISGQAEKATKITVADGKNAKFDYVEASIQPDYLWGTSSEEQTQLFSISDLRVKHAENASVADKLTENTVGASDTPIYLNDGVPTAGKQLGSAAYQSKDDFSLTGHTHEYLPLSGGSMTGTITAKGESQGDDPEATALDMNNSNISGIIAMYFGRTASDVNDGINFPNDDKSFDRLFAVNGNLYFVPKRKQFESGEEKIVLHSGNFEMYAAPVSHTHPYLSSLGGVMTGDLTLRPETGTVGGRIKLKPSVPMTTESGITIEQYSTGLRIYGIPSADETTVEGTGTPLIINPYNKTIIGGYELTGSLNGTATNAVRAEVSDSTDKLNNALTLSSSEAVIDTFDGSNPKTITITPTSIGASPEGHEHAQYLTEHQDITNKANKNGEYPDMKVGYATKAGSASASDVYSWAKAETKPSYSWSEINNKPESYPPTNHTHDYAGSASRGGPANSAMFLEGNSEKPNTEKYGLSYFMIPQNAATATAGTTINAVPSTDSGYHVLRMHYSNNFFTDIAASINKPTGLYYRQIINGSEVAYRRILDSNNWSAYCAAASHSHSYLPLAGGTMTGQIKKAGVSSSWYDGRVNAAIAITSVNGYSPALSCKSTAGSWEVGTYNHTVYANQLVFTYTSDTNYSAKTNATSQIKFTSDGGISATGSITGTTVYNAVYNDYAELFPRGEETEPGDLISLDLNSDKEQYIKASSENPCVVGIHSDEFAHLIGGEEPENGENFVEYNLPKYIPVSLAGRVRVKFKGRAIKGAYAVPSDIPGVAEMSKNPNNSIGIIVEADNREDIRRIKILLRK